MLDCGKKMVTLDAQVGRPSAQATLKRVFSLAVVLVAIGIVAYKTELERYFLFDKSNTANGAGADIISCSLAIKHLDGSGYLLDGLIFCSMEQDQCSSVVHSSEHKGAEEIIQEGDVFALICTRTTKKINQ